jgi:hypothetical protein
MQKTGIYFTIAAIAAATFAPLPVAAIGIGFGPFHFGLPFFWHHRRHHLYMRANPNDLARPALPSTGPQGATSALLDPSEELPAILQNILWPIGSPPWPFGYENIFSAAFTNSPANQISPQCRPAVDARSLMGRIESDTKPTPDQIKLLQRLGGALGAAASYLAKACPHEIPAQPIARLQLMEQQIEQLAMAIDIVRQPLEDFEQSLNSNQRARSPGGGVNQTSGGQRDGQVTGAVPCGGSSAAIDGSIDQIDKSVWPTDA